jgi:hypothetical protein
MFTNNCGTSGWQSSSRRRSPPRTIDTDQKQNRAGDLQFARKSRSQFGSLQRGSLDGLNSSAIWEWRAPKPKKIDTATNACRKKARPYMAESHPAGARFKKQKIAIRADPCLLRLRPVKMADEQIEIEMSELIAKECW